MNVKRFRAGAQILVLAALIFATGPFLGAHRAEAQSSGPASAAEPDRQATGGAQTLQDILDRQRGLQVNDTFRRNATGDPAQAASTRAPLGTLGGVSDPELWRALRYDSANVSVSTRLPTARTSIQSSGIAWLELRRGPLVTYGGGLLLAIIALLSALLVVKGKFKLEYPASGINILRFSSIERFSHWMLAGSFIVLGLTGLTQLMGRAFLIPLLGKQSYSTIATVGKWAHNNFAWAFMLGLVLIFVLWVSKNIPERSDITWLAKAGGLFTKGSHPPSKKFNAGQKLMFWMVIVLGSATSLLGLSLLFPFELPIFTHVFSWLNNLGIPHILGMQPFPTQMAPQAEMQLAQVLHAVIAFVMMAVILGHIYIGSIGMEGAIEAMVSGSVDEEWAREHHSLWLESEKAKEKAVESVAKPEAEPAASGKGE